MKVAVINRALLAYLLCLPLVLINKSFLASINIFGLVLYLRTKKNISIRNLGLLSFFINITILIILIIRISADRNLIRVWGGKLGRDIVVHSFNNPNTEAEFFYFCALGVWFIIKNKYLRTISVTIIVAVGYQMTSGRSYLLASALLIITDLFINKKRLPFFKKILIAAPVAVTILSFVIGYITRNMAFFYSLDDGLAGRLFILGYIIKQLDPLKLLVGFSNIMTGDYPIDVSTFAIFATRGIVMLVFLLAQYIKYIRYISSYYKYVPAMMSLVVAGLMLPSMAWFSINMVIFLYLAEDSRKKNKEFSAVFKGRRVNIE
jgi:hypothetical protein